MKEPFSERMGVNPNRIRKQKMNDGIKNRLWSHLYLFIFQYYEKPISKKHKLNLREQACGALLLHDIILTFLKIPIDELENNDPKYLVQIIRGKYFSMDWFEIYDFIEYLISNINILDFKYIFISQINYILEEEKGEYRIVSEHFSPLINDLEITQIENAMTSPYQNVNTHLNKGLILFSERTHPDYENSIKESISALESLCQIIEDNELTLGKNIDLVGKKLDMHPEYCSQIKIMYSFASDSQIRHGTKKNKVVEEADARLFLVIISGWINYIIDKNNKDK